MVQHLIDVMPAFLLACLILAVLPGPATALFLHRSVRDGRAAGLAAVVGNEIGIFGWTLAGGAGLSVLLMANRALSVALHVVGAVILIWLGISAWRNAKLPADIDVPLSPRGRTPAAAFRASLVSIAANPKAAAFGIAVIPQFLPSKWSGAADIAGAGGHSARSRHRVVRGCGARRGSGPRTVGAGAHSSPHRNACSVPCNGGRRGTRGRGAMT
jgi:threonine/homoserine/homoserine lactone efflux protein